MAYEFRFQDPASDDTRYLDEEIIAQLLDAETTEIEAIFAFASVAGVLSLLRDTAFEAFVRREGRVRLVVGLDAVTDKGALLVLQEAERRFAPHLSVRVFKNRQSGLFHPKLVRAHRRDGSRLLVAGSGNHTPGGLRSNIEAYSVYRFDRTVLEVDAEWDRFLREHEEELSEIDDEALERGARNADRLAAARGAARTTRHEPRGRVRREEPAAAVSADEEAIDLIGEIAPPAAPTDHMLVAQVPKAGGRWHQVHFNGQVVREYFRARPHSADRVLLYRVEPGGVVVGEPPRAVVLSGTNLNHRIEFGARAGADYPTEGPPILVVREIGLRSHSYVLLLPGEPGYDDMAQFLATHPTVGRGARRVITRRADVSSAWPGLPL
jgi:hypothetical protein